jgi:hypothetical protein
MTMDSPQSQRDPIDPQMQQRLRDLAEGRLSGQEAVELHRQIASDGHLALAYAEIRRQLEFARPGTTEASRNLFRELTSGRSTGAADASRGRSATYAPASAAGRRAWARWSNWIVGLMAAALLAVSLGGYVYHRGQLFGLASEHLRLRVTGPSQLQLGFANRYSIAATSITGRGLPAQVEFTLRSLDNKPILSHKEKSDASGRLDIVVPSDLKLPADVKLEVAAVYGSQTERFSTQLATKPLCYVAHLAVDRTEYQPGETIRYRVVLLPWLVSSGGRTPPIRVELRGPQGGVVPGSLVEPRLEGNVASAEFTLSGTAETGCYTLAVRSVEPGFVDQELQVPVLRPPTPDLKLDLEFVRGGLQPGDKAIALYSCASSDGKPLAKATVEAKAVVDGRIVYQGKSETNVVGEGRVEFTLPSAIHSPSAILAVTATHNTRTNSSAKRIPLSANRVQTRFFPEGGELVAGLENRVYFTSFDPLDRPIAVRGEILDTHGRAVAVAESNRAGMGVFSLVPATGEQYRLRFQTPGGLDEEPRLPESVAVPPVVLTTGLGIVDAGEPLEFNVRSHGKSRIPLVAVATSRGIHAGQRVLVSEEKTNTASIPLDPNVAGLVRLTLFDYRESPPKPIASRWVFRRPADSLRVAATGDASIHRPGEKATLHVQATTRPTRAPSADAKAKIVLSAAATRLPGATAPESRAPSLATEILLAEVVADHPAARETAEFALSSDSKAPAMLDLLLGTTPSQTFGAAAERRDDGPDARRSSEPSGLASGGSPPLMMDNLTELTRRFEDSLSLYRRHQTRILNTVITLSFFGGVALVVFVVMLAILSIPCEFRVWGPAVVAALASMFVGVVLMNPSRVKGSLQGAVPFAVFDGSRAAGSTIFVQSQPGGAEVSHGELRLLKRLARRCADRSALAAEPASLLWMPRIGVGDDGRAAIPLAMPEAPASVSIGIDATDSDGRFGSTGMEVPLSLPLRVDAWTPDVATAGDRIGMPVHVTNATGRKLGVDVSVKLESGLQTPDPKPRKIEIAPNGNGRVTASIVPEPGAATGRLTVRASSEVGSPSVARSLRIESLGFPREKAYNGWLDPQASIAVEMPGDAVPGSFDVSLQLFPTVASQCAAAAEALDRNPSSNVEQAISTCLIDAICLDDVAQRGLTGCALAQRTRESMREAWQKTLDFESPTKGLDWFGASPGQESLTAYGLIAFRDVARHQGVDRSIVSRSSQWLLSQVAPKTSAGKTASAAPPEPARSAYIAWAAATAGMMDSGLPEFRKPWKTAVAQAMASDDPYTIALAASAALAGNAKREGRDLLAKLAPHQAQDGSVRGKSASVLRATGVSFQTETTALAATAWLQHADFAPHAERAVRWILLNRRADGTFGTPQATALALRAIHEYDDAHRQSVTDGRLVVRLGETILAERTIAGRDAAPLRVDGLGVKMQSGVNRLSLDSKELARMPYTLAVTYRSAKADNTAEPPLTLATKLAETKLRAGQIVAMLSELENTSEKPASMATVVIRLPAGLDLPRDQLESLKKSKTIDQYDFRPSEVRFFWRSMASRQKITWQLNLVASTPGRYTSQPACAFLGYAPENKRWVGPLSVEIAEQP